MNIITQCRGIKGKIHIFNCWVFRDCAWGRRGGKGETNQLYCANDEKLQINDSSRRWGAWSNRRASQMQLTQGIVNAHSTLQNIISPRLPPRCIWKPNKLVGSGRSRGAGGGRASCMAGQPAPRSPAGGCAAPRQRRCRAGRAEPCPGSAGPARPALAAAVPPPAASASSASFLRAGDGERRVPRLEPSEGLQQVRERSGDCRGREGTESTVRTGREEFGSSLCTPSGLCIPEDDL